MKVLIICSDYKSELDANGICVKNIASALKQDGNSVYILSEKKQKPFTHHYDGIATIYYVKSTLLKRTLDCYNNNLIYRIKLSIIRIIHAIISIVLYPNVSPFRSRKVIKKATEIVNKHNVDIVIGCYRPYESIKAIMSMKKNSGIKTVAYHLDLLMEPNDRSKVIRTFKKKKAKHSIIEERRNVDYIVLPETERNKISGKNVMYAGFPLYIKECVNTESSIVFDYDVVNITYIGSLDETNRNPIELLEELTKLKVGRKPIIVHIWGKINSDSLEEQISAMTNVEYHGYIPHDQVFDVMRKSDFLLNISNKVTANMVPSKIFQMFSTGRGIINYVQSKEDVSAKYFERYGFFFEIDQWKMREFDYDILTTWISENYGVICDIKENEFKSCTPEYFVSLLKRIEHI